MTLGQMIKKYKAMKKANDYIDVGTVLQDLWQVNRHIRLQNVPKEDR